MATGNIALNFAGRVFSVTGGASGMGLATASLLAHHGAKAIYIADRQTKLFDSVRSHLSSLNSSVKIHLNDIDVSSSGDVDSWVNTIKLENGALHGAANIAGVPEFVLKPETGKPSLLQQTDEDWRRILSVNLDGVMYCTRAQFRVMAEMSKESNPSIVNISSLGALIHPGVNYAYCTSKAACEYFTRNAAKDGFRHGIRVNAILPGNVKTPMTKGFFGSEEQAKKIGSSLGLSNMLEPTDVARAVIWLLSEHSLTVNGTGLIVGEGAP